MPVSYSGTQSKAKALIGRDKTWELLVEGKSAPEIAAELGISIRTAYRYVQRAINCHEKMPAGLSPDQMAAKREVIAARLERKLSGLAKVEARMADLAFNAQEERACTEAGKSYSQCIRTSAIVNRELAQLWGCHAPQRIVEQQLQLQVKRTESRYEITFDEEKFFSQSRSPAAGLIRGGALLARESTSTFDDQTDDGHDAMPDTDAA
jgi:transposase